MVTAWPDPCPCSADGKLRGVSSVVFAASPRCNRRSASGKGATRRPPRSHTSESPNGSPPEPPLRATLQAPHSGASFPSSSGCLGIQGGLASSRELRRVGDCGAASPPVAWHCVPPPPPAASTRQLPARCRPEPRPSPTCCPPRSLPPPTALPFPRDSQLQGCLPQGAAKPGQLDSAARNPLRGAAGLARRAPEPLRMCAMRAAESHATPPSDRLPALGSDTTLAVGNFPNLARTGSPPHTHPSPSSGGSGCALNLAELGPDRCPSRAAPARVPGRGRQGRAGP